MYQDLLWIGHKNSRAHRWWVSWECRDPLGIRSWAGNGGGCRAPSSPHAWCPVRSWPAFRPPKAAFGPPAASHRPSLGHPARWGNPVQYFATAFNFEVFYFIFFLWIKSLKKSILCLLLILKFFLIFYFFLWIKSLKKILCLLNKRSKNRAKQNFLKLLHQKWYQNMGQVKCYSILYKHITLQNKVCPT